MNRERQKIGTGTKRWNEFEGLTESNYAEIDMTTELCSGSDFFVKELVP